jgi:hypothetical protein
MPRPERAELHREGSSGLIQTGVNLLGDAIGCVFRGKVTCPGQGDKRAPGNRVRSQSAFAAKVGVRSPQMISFGPWLFAIAAPDEVALGCIAFVSLQLRRLRDEAGEGAAASRQWIAIITE